MEPSRQPPCERTEAYKDYPKTCRCLLQRSAPARSGAFLCSVLVAPPGMKRNERDAVPWSKLRSASRSTAGVSTVTRRLLSDPVHLMVPRSTSTLRTVFLGRVYRLNPDETACEADRDDWRSAVFPQRIAKRVMRVSSPAARSMTGRVRRIGFGRNQGLLLAVTPRSTSRRTETAHVQNLRDGRRVRDATGLYLPHDRQHVLG